MRTLVIQTDNGPVIINEEDFNPATHTLANPDDMPLPVAPQLVPAAAATVMDANGNPVNPGDSGQFVPSPQLRTDGPTIAEYVSAGYPASAYPPNGYESRSTPEEIAAAQTPQPTPEKLLVSKDGKKFAVVNEDGEPVKLAGIDASGYKTEKEAWDAIMAFNATKSA